MGDKKLVLIGAGMTGRGQIAQLAFEDGWDLTLVDKDRRLIDLLRRQGRYTVRLLSAAPRDVVVEGFDAIHSGEMERIAAAVRNASLVVTSVLEPNLSDVGQMLASALSERLKSNAGQPLNVIAAENMEHSSSDLRGYVLAHLDEKLSSVFPRSVGFPNSMISRVVPVADDPLFIVTEEYSEWTADLNARQGEPPDLSGLEWVSNQPARLQRKLYIHNTGHVICAFLGMMAGFRFIHEAAQDPVILGHVQHAIDESGAAVSAEHQFSRDEVKEYENHLLQRLRISALADDIRRVVRHPLRKLGKEERLLGPLQLCIQHNLPHEELCFGIAAVLAGCRKLPGNQNADEQAVRIRQALEIADPLSVLSEFVAYQPPARTGECIAAAYNDLLTRSF